MAKIQERQDTSKKDERPTYWSAMQGAAAIQNQIGDFRENFDRLVIVKQFPIRAGDRGSECPVALCFVQLIEVSYITSRSARAAPGTAVTTLSYTFKESPTPFTLPFWYDRTQTPITVNQLDSDPRLEKLPLSGKPDPMPQNPAPSPSLPSPTPNPPSPSLPSPTPNPPSPSLPSRTSKSTPTAFSSSSPLPSPTTQPTPEPDLHTPGEPPAKSRTTEIVGATVGAVVLILILLLIFFLHRYRKRAMRLTALSRHHDEVTKPELEDTSTARPKLTIPAHAFVDAKELAGTPAWIGPRPYELEGDQPKDYKADRAPNPEGTTPPTKDAGPSLTSSRRTSSTPPSAPSAIAPPMPTSESTSPSPKSYTTLIIGTTLGSVAVIAIITILIYLLYRYQKRLKRAHDLAMVGHGLKVELVDTGVGPLEKENSAGPGVAEMRECGPPVVEFANGRLFELDGRGAVVGKREGG
ncbi:hypothetical protein BJ508DRAFT_366591 [Ascobolus immersus RN42]|uniref:Uncharacterized protein n=1 Tax=Ascobolus immersus RN42 TaxID=1160509 RepID=A0A3N4HP22_ASCIM|nr:hypothetical protein BJ508DRAFT_366591 [Ascobolus immersus RN42]